MIFRFSNARLFLYAMLVAYAVGTAVSVAPAAWRGAGLLERSIGLVVLLCIAVYIGSFLWTKYDSGRYDNTR